MAEHQPYSDSVLEAFLATRDVPCPSCGYNLRGLQSTTCPECHTELRLGLSSDTGWVRKVLPISVVAAAGMTLYAGVRSVQAIVELSRFFQSVWVTRSFYFHFSVGLILNISVISLLLVAAIRLLLAHGPAAIDQRRRAFVRTTLLCAAINSVFICVYALMFVFGLS